MAKNRSVAVLFGVLLVGGCGTYVPAMQELGENPGAYSEFSPSGDLEFKIRAKVYCDIVDAVIAARGEGVLPTGWAVQVTLDLQVDETGSLNPGVTFIDPLAGSQSFSIGVGGVLSSTATREDKYGSYWDLDRLQSRTGNPCRSKGEQVAGSSLLLSELGVTEWLIDSLKGRDFLPSSAGMKGDPFFKQDFLSYHIKFVVVSSGGITPTWKLVRLSTGNGGLPLVGAGRTRSHDLLLTFGPTFKAGAPNLAISSHAAQDFGIAVSNSVRNGARTFAPPQ
ncbi:hypothetical protein P0R31_35185 [Bradyrhizobium yuanmingense]|uniref:hypothetical protein n=1 Tax=Bradyrhizobium yuanmingense TaxID=108015 RepID=UPI0023BA2383|nr:hypothetical protein [Bradyrhizobium yuanmingense]MDF0522486.1 hypothetical protein [Bradyrhizobium yuanmingense]